MKRTTGKIIMIVAGEASGDMRGAELMKAMKEKKQGLSFRGIGGDRMIAEGLNAIHHVNELSFLGFIEVLKHLPFLRRVMREMREHLDKEKPDMVVLVDYPGFNLRLAREVHKRGIPLVYYVSPQIWAWGRGRLKKMAKCIDRMVVLFPFEEALYSDAGMDVRFVGHPLKEEVKVRLSKDAFFRDTGLDISKPTLALLPGSRSQEIRHILPELKRAAEILGERIPDLQVLLAKAPTLPDDTYEPYLRGKLAIQTVREKTYEVMAHSDLALVASGTATLETALLGTPMVVVYKISWPSYLMARCLVKLPNIGLVNIVAGRTIVPECIQRSATGRRIAETALEIYNDRGRYERIVKDLKEIANSLGEAGAAGRAADSVIEMLERNR